MEEETKREDRGRGGGRGEDSVWFDMDFVVVDDVHGCAKVRENIS